jgi:phosphatidylserine decarboxylase
MKLALFLLFFLLLFFIFLAYFNRCPIPINIPYLEGQIVAPAYGKIIDIERVENTTIIKIMLNIFDVHVQYAPISGILEKLIYSPGKHGFVNQNNIQIGKTLDNENLLYVLKQPNGLVIGMRQIAGKFARRCISFYSEGDIIQQQQPIGRILFGSQVDLILPSQMQIKCTNGDYLIGGETVIARI